MIRRAHPPAALILAGGLTHTRHAAPARHFGYRLWMLALDLDRIDELAAASRVFRANCFGLIAHRDADHGARDGSALRPWVEHQLKAAGLSHAGARIHLLALPRLLGFTFNPISFYFCHDETGRLAAIVHEVKNTIGGQHAYALPVAPDADGAIRQSAEKCLYVSPFFDMGGGYRFAIRAPDFTAPGGRLNVAISYGTPETPRLTATLRLTARAYTDGAALAQWARMPGVAVKIFAAILWQALRLWLAGARYHRPPEDGHGVPAPSPATLWRDGPVT